MLGAKHGLSLIIMLLAPALIAADRQATPPPPAPPQEIAIASPQAGSVLQGIVPVTIYSDVPGLVYSELAFTYHGDPTNTWFTLYEGGQALAGEIAVEWDTGAITDGDYTLRLIVALSDGSYRSVLVEGLRVRNYSPVEMDTPTPPSATPTIVSSTIAAPVGSSSPTILPTTAIPITPSPAAAVAPTLPPNPAEVSPIQVWQSITRGIVAALGLLALAGLYGSLRRLGRHHEP